MIASRGCSIFGLGTVSQRMLPFPCHASALIRDTLSEHASRMFREENAFLRRLSIRRDYCRILAAGMPEGAVVSAPWFLHDAGRGGAGNPEQQNKGDDMTHGGFPL